VKKLRGLFLTSACLLGWFSLMACGPQKKGLRVYVTNEASGDVSVIDATTDRVIQTIAVGKRPRGIQVSPDNKTVYIALSGSPFAGPNVKDEDLPPADKRADGIGVIAVDKNELTGILPGGSDPEQFVISRDGARLYISNEDAAGLSSNRG
jgi:YVTN family beta-propeller protein